MAFLNSLVFKDKGGIHTCTHTHTHTHTHIYIYIYINRQEENKRGGNNPTLDYHPHFKLTYYITYPNFSLTLVCK